MGAAITLLVILTLSVVVVRVAAVALRLTGIAADVARFQARSAFTGTGFTTSESEAIVNHPIRRRVIGFLMLQGNIGLVTVLATFVVSFVATENSMAAVSRQLLWLLGTIALLWLIALNPYADRLMCRWIGRLLQRFTPLGQRGPAALLQLSSLHSVAEHWISCSNIADGLTLSDFSRDYRRILILGIEHEDGGYSSAPDLGTRLVSGDRLILYGSDEDLMKLGLESSNRAAEDQRCDSHS